MTASTLLLRDTKDTRSFFTRGEREAREKEEGGGERGERRGERRVMKIATRRGRL